MADLQENTVQHTLCIPLWGRMIAAEKYPDLFPDRDAGRIVGELGVDFSDKLLYKLQYTWMNCVIRQYNLAWEIEHYLKDHPRAAVVELGAGLSCLRREMGNDQTPGTAWIWRRSSPCGSGTSPWGPTSATWSAT